MTGQPAKAESAAAAAAEVMSQLFEPAAAQPAGLSNPILVLCCVLAALCCLGGYLTSRVLAYKNSEQRRLHREEAQQAAAESAAQPAAQEEATFAGSPFQAHREAGQHGLQRRGSSRASGQPGSVLQVSPLPILTSMRTEPWDITMELEGQLPGVQDTDDSGMQRYDSNREAEGRCPPEAAGSSRHHQGGLWAGSIWDGEHHFTWPDGGQYYGQWHSSQPHGRGVFVWPSGDRYEGEWQSGRENGTGTAIAPDGSTFYGYWVDGKRHGEGVYRPATPENHRADVIFLRDYRSGVMASETVLRVADKDAQRETLKAVAREQRRADGRRSGKHLHIRPGEVVYKGHDSYDLMRNLQLGILFGIAKSGRSMSALRSSTTDPSDFNLHVTQYFPRGPESTPFKWKDYCPTVFQRLRQMYGIDNKDYLLSLTGDSALRLLASPGKSGSVFFLAEDDRFMIKTMRHEEMSLLLQLMPRYYNHVYSNPGTLLTRFFAVHRVKPLGGQKVRFVVMGNVFPTDVKLHRRYDLKGSTLGRTASKKTINPSTVLKDLDIDFQLRLSSDAHAALMSQLASDCTLLTELRVMDYSLLLGVHFLRWGENEWHPPQAQKQFKNRLFKAASNTHNPLHCFVGHTHTYPQPRRQAEEGSDGEEYSMAGETPVAAMPEGNQPGLPQDTGPPSQNAQAAAVATPANWQSRKGLGRSMSGRAPRPRHQRSLTSMDSSQQASFQAGTVRGAPGDTLAGPSSDSAGSVQPAQQSQRTAKKPRLDTRPSRELLRYASELGLPGVAPTQPSIAEETSAAPSPVPASPAEQQGERRQVSFTAATSKPAPASCAAEGYDGEASVSSSAAVTDRGEESGGLLKMTDSMRQRMAWSPFASDTVQSSAAAPCGAAGAGLNGVAAVAACQGLVPTAEALRRSAMLQRASSGPAHLQQGLRHKRRRQGQRSSGSLKRAMQEGTFGSLLRESGMAMPDGLVGTSASESEDSWSDSPDGGRPQPPLPALRRTRTVAGSRTRMTQHLSTLSSQQQAGTGVPAMAVPKDGGPAEPVLVYFGIIDFLQEYSLRKKMEHVMKATVFDGKAISVVDPQTYSLRFQDFMRGIFVCKAD